MIQFNKYKFLKAYFFLVTVGVICSCNNLKYSCYGTYDEKSQEGKLVWFYDSHGVLLIDICPWETIDCWYVQKGNQESINWKKLLNQMVNSFSDSVLISDFGVKKINYSVLNNKVFFNDSSFAIYNKEELIYNNKELDYLTKVKR